MDRHFVQGVGKLNPQVLHTGVTSRDSGGLLGGRWASGEVEALVSGARSAPLSRGLSSWRGKKIIQYE